MIRQGSVRSTTKSEGTIYELTLKLKTTRIILINNINNLFQQLARQSTPCRAQDKHIVSTGI